jgi:SOS-response transcriptional repressor LexA
MTLGDDLRSGNYASHNSVVWLIRCLERRGFIRRIPASPRAIEVLRLPHEAAVRTAA